jgi:hypothetical protein
MYPSKSEAQNLMSGVNLQYRVRCAKIEKTRTQLQESQKKKKGEDRKRERRI